MSSAGVSGIPISHSGVLATPVRSKVDKFFDLLNRIARVIENIFGFLAWFFSIRYSAEIIQALISFGVPVYPAFVLNITMMMLFVDHVFKRN